jgi:4-amino-4-deoxy-L-arabinose transferase-like glycosyltransferase
MKRENKVLLILFTLAFCLRLAYVYYTFNETGDSKWSDAKLYVFYGKEFASGNLFPEIDGEKLIVPPVIPLVFAISQLVRPDSYWPYFIYNILLSSVLVIFLYFIGKLLYNKILGFFFALWGLLFFDYWKYTPEVLKEPTICFLLILMVFFVFTYWKKGRRLKALIGIGLSFVLLIHTDERYFAFFPMILLVPLIFENRIRVGREPVLRTTILLFLVFMLMIPWTIRNYIEYKEIVILTPRTTAITSNFWGTNLSSISFEGNFRAVKLMEDRADIARNYSARYGIAPHIQKGFESKIMAFINFWQPTYFRPTFIQYGYRFQKWSLMHNLTGILFYGIFLPFYILACIKFICQKRVDLIWLSSIPIIHSLVHAWMVWPLERYRMPINFIIVLLAMLYVFDLIAGNGKLQQQIRSFISRNFHIKLNTNEI